jgi:leader peptidase (prepilin peptidase) / N-methyltransferase
MLTDALLIALVAVLGLAIGSFMTVVAARVPAGDSIVRPRSRCPSCGSEIATRDNVPLLGWIMLGGRCRSCKARIPVTYPLLELSTALLMVGSFVVYDDVLVAIAVAGLFALMPVITVIDIQHRIIPNKIMYPALITLPAYLIAARLADAPVDLLRMAIGLLSYGGALFVVALVSGGMGMGDVKLAALIGAVLGAIGLDLVGVAAGSAIVVGSLGAVVALARGAGRKGAFPFGPALAAGAIVAAFWGRQIADWYARTILHV